MKDLKKRLVGYSKPLPVKERRRRSIVTPSDSVTAATHWEPCRWLPHLRFKGKLMAVWHAGCKYQFTIGQIVEGLLFPMGARTIMVQERERGVTITVQPSSVLLVTFLRITKTKFLTPSLVIN